MLARCRLALSLCAFVAGCAAIAGLDADYVVGDGSPTTGATGVSDGGSAAAGAGGEAGSELPAGGDYPGGSGGAGGVVGAGGSGGAGLVAYDSCHQALTLQGSAVSNPFWINTPSGPQLLYCDMETDGGGWTLVGQVAAKFDNYTTWLKSDVNVANLQTAAIEPAVYSCIDAVHLAVAHATEIRLSNSTIDRWVKWPMDVGRTEATWWHHEVGYGVVDAATQNAVSVVAYDGGGDTCYQNVYGIMPWELHGGSYPAASRNEAGNTSPDDWCMAVGVMLEHSSAHGFGQNNNGWDAPAQDLVWPNTDYNSAPIVSVWLR